MVLEKDCISCLVSLDFRLDIRADLKITDYLDVTLNLYSGTVSPFRKRNQDLRYVNRGSNHPTQVF